MGFVAKKVRIREDGSIYWQIVFEDRRKERPPGVARETTIHRDKLYQYGIGPKDKFEKVQEICRRLNEKDRLKKADERSRVRAMKRWNAIKSWKVYSCRQQMFRSLKTEFCLSDLLAMIKTL